MGPIHFQSDGAAALQSTAHVVDILGRIRDRLDTLSPAERKVGAAVLANVRGTIEESSANLAQRAEVSEPSVTRFCLSLIHI